MAMAANRIGGIRAAVIWSVEGATETREDNDSNVLALPARFIDTETALAIVDEWIKAPFSGDERQLRRRDQLEELYG
jgi:ribose 5-phosphate isomerase B